MSNRRNNFLAGLLVLAAIFSATAITIWLGGYRERLGKRDYLVEFSLDVGVAGLDPGSVVTIGGEEVGVVTLVEFHPEPTAADPTSIRVGISIDKDFRLREGAIAYLVAPLLGGGSTVNFISLGDEGGAQLGAADPIGGRIAPPSFLASAGIGDQEVGEVKNIVQGASEFVDKMNVIADDTRTIVGDVREVWPDWRIRMDNITTNVDATTARGPALAEDLELRVEDLRELLATAQSYMDDNRASVDQAIENVRDGSDNAKLFLERLEGELADKAAGFLDQGNEALATANEALVKVDEAIDEEMPGVRRSLANVRLATGQLAATSAEVRRAPWRLLYRPDTRELEFELLYDAARSYAGAVSDLRNAGESMSGSIDAMNATGEVDSDRVTQLIDQLDTAFASYKATEERFLQLVSDHAAGD